MAAAGADGDMAEVGADGEDIMAEEVGVVDDTMVDEAGNIPSYHPTDTICDPDD